MPPPLMRNIQLHGSPNWELKILYCVDRDFQFQDRNLPTMKQVEEGWVGLPEWVVENLFEDGMNLLGPTGQGPMEAIFQRMNSYATNPLAEEYPNRIGNLPPEDELATHTMQPNPRIGQDWMSENGVHHTSMSVGDIVVLSGFDSRTDLNGYYYTKNIGFDKLSFDE